MTKHKGKGDIEAGAMPLDAAAAILALGSGRAALRDVIAACVAANLLHRANAEAHERAEAAVVETYSAESQAEAAVEKAKSDAPARLAALFRGEEVEDAQTVEQAEAALASVRQKRADMRAARDALEKETARAGNRAEWKAEEVMSAIASVVKASPEAGALFDAYVAAERRYTALRLAIDVLQRAGALPDRAVSHRPDEPDRLLSHQWAGAIEGLRSDYDASLPEAP